MEVSNANTYGLKNTTFLAIIIIAIEALYIADAANWLNVNYFNFRL